MALNLKKETAVQLWEKVRLARRFTRENWKERLDKDVAIYSGDHYAEVMERGGEHGKQISIPTPTVNVHILHSSLALQTPDFEVEPEDFSDVDALLDGEDTGAADALLGKLSPAGGAQAPQMAPPMGGASPFGDPMAGAVDPMGDPMGLMAQMQAQMEAQAQAMEERRNRVRDLLPLVLSRRVTDDFIESGAWEAAKAALLDKYARGGVGVVFTGWRSGEPDPMAPPDPKVAEYLAELSQMEGVAAQDLEMPIPEVGEGPFTEHIDPYDLIIDPTVKWHNWQNADYIGWHYALPLDQVKEVYGKSAEDVQGSAKLAVQTDLSYNPVREEYPESAEFPYCLLYEVWFRRVRLPRGYTDPDTGKRYPAGEYPLRVVWASERPDQPLKCEVWKFDLRDGKGRRLWPFDILFHRVVPGKFKAQSAVELMEPQMREVEMERNIVSTLAEETAGYFFEVEEGALTTDGEDALEHSREPGRIVKKTPGAAPEAVRVGAMPDLKQSVMVVGEQGERDMNMASAVNEMAQGQGFDQEKKATEVSLIASMGGSRAALEQREWEDFLSSIAWKQYQLRRQMEYAGDHARVTLPDTLDPSNAPQTFTMQKEFMVPARVKIVANSTKLQNAQQDVANLVNVYNMTAATGQLATPHNPLGELNGKDFIKQMLTRMDLFKESLFDTSEYQQMAQAQQQAALQAQMAAAMGQGGPPGQGDPSQGGSPSAAPPQGGAQEGPPMAQGGPEAQPGGEAGGLPPEVMDLLGQLPEEALDQLRMMLEGGQA